MTPTLHQPFACLLGIDPETSQIVHVSANAADILGQQAETLLHANARALFGREFWHALRNAASHPEFETGRRAIGLSDAGALAETLDLRAFPSNNVQVVEVAPRLPSEFGVTRIAEVARSIMAQLLPLASETAMADGLTHTLRHILGYEHLLLWRVERSGTARAISETKRRSQKSYLGAERDVADLWPGAAPPFDIIADVNAAMPPLLSTPYAPLPDLATAHCHVPDRHNIDALDRADMRSSLRLRLTCNGLPWGVLEAKNSLPRRPSDALLLLMETIALFVVAKLQAVSKD